MYLFFERRGGGPPFLCVSSVTLAHFFSFSVAIFYASDGERSGECWRAGNGEISDQITVQITGWGGVARAHCRQVKAIARSAVHSHCIEERERVKEEY